MALLTQAEIRLAAERRLKYQGTAKINLNQIQVPLDSDTKKLKRLRGIFLKEGCLRLDDRNHVVCTVSRRNLEASLQRAGATAGSLLTNSAELYQHLCFPDENVKCLHGRHRIKVGRKVLPPTDRWWTVDLYLDGKMSRCAVGLLG